MAADECHRATDGYAVRVANHLGDSLQFGACSGAIISDFLSPQNSDQPEQLYWVQSFDSLVTVSVGGDDVGFQSLLTDCLYATGWGKGPGCEARDQVLVNQELGFLQTGMPSGCFTLPGDSVTGGPAPSVCGPIESLTQLYLSIVQKAPTARILVMGYPHLFGTSFSNGSCRVGTALGIDHVYISQGDATWLNAEDDTLDGIISQAVKSAASTTGAHIKFVDPRPTFSGHEICGTSTPMINALLFQSKIAWPPVSYRVESFHPNIAGQDALASLLEGIAK